MDIGNFVNAVSTVGFPIVCCLSLMFYVKYSVDNFAQNVKEITEKHHEETKAMLESINNNTTAIQELTLFIREREVKA